MKTIVLSGSGTRSAYTAISLARLCNQPIVIVSTNNQSKSVKLNHKKL